MRSCSRSVTCDSAAAPALVAAEALERVELLAAVEALGEPAALEAFADEVPSAARAGALCTAASGDAATRASPDAPSSFLFKGRASGIVNNAAPASVNIAAAHPHAAI